MEIVRLIHGDEHPEGPGFIEEVVPERRLGRRTPSRRQFVDIGTRLDVDDPQGLLDLQGPLTLHAFVFPTTPMKGRQAILARWAIHETSGYGLGINTSGHLEFWVGDGTETDAIAAEVPLLHHTWYFVAVTYDPGSGTAYLRQQAIVNPYNARLGLVAPFDATSRVRQKLRLKPKGGERPFRWASATMQAEVRGTFSELGFNGKIDRAGVYGRVLSDEELDASPRAARRRPRASSRSGTRPRATATTASTTSCATPGRTACTGAASTGRCARMTGWNWQGRADDWRLAPEQYGGIGFHDDAITDCGWEPTLSWTVPAGTRSGAYAARVHGGRRRGPRRVLRAAREADGARSSSSRRRTRTWPTRTR